MGPKFKVVWWPIPSSHRVKVTAFVCLFGNDVKSLYLRLFKLEVWAKMLSLPQLLSPQAHPETRQLVSNDDCGEVGRRTIGMLGRSVCASHKYFSRADCDQRQPHNSVVKLTFRIWILGVSLLTVSSNFSKPVFSSVTSFVKRLVGCCEDSMTYTQKVIRTSE